MTQKPQPLLETERGKRWLSQFSEIDRPTAIRIAISLELVSRSAFEIGLRSALEKVAISAGGLVALFAAREITDQEKVSHYLGPFKSKRKTFRPIPVAGQNDVGSEGELAHTIGNLAAEDRRYLDHPSLAVMAKKKVRHIVLLDDYLGTGGRVRKFIDHLYEHPTIKSWVSYRLVTFHIVSYGATASALAYIKSEKPLISAHPFRVGPTFDDRGWSLAEKREVIDLCERYGKISGNSRFSLGYDQSQALLVFEYGCPNNVPSILWSEKGTYVSLFPRRSIPQDLLVAFARRPERHLAVQALERLGQLRLSKAAQIMKYDALTTVLFLAAISKRARRSVRVIENVSVFTGLSIEECNELRSRCLKTRLIDASNRLTEAGRQELERLRRLQPRKGFDGLTLSYYPRALKGP